MAKTIGVMLKLKDGFSKGFEKFREQTTVTERETKRLQNRVKNLGNDAQNTFTNFAKHGVAAVGTMGAAMVGLGAKAGFAEALDLQGYKMQLETATKDTGKAAKIMRDAVSLANKTPFEAGELVQAASMFESMGMSAKKWLPLTGDMAAATNKSFEQATEALIDAQTGELERLKEFGITKAMIADQANKMFADQQVVNNKGQIVDQEKFNEAMIALMKDKYTGGMEAQAKTIRGMWSTVTGVTKSALATMLGMTTEGTLRSGSALDILSGKVGWLAKQFDKWQQDGTIKRWAQSFDAGIKKTIEVAIPILQSFGNGIKFVADKLNVIAPIALGVATGFKALSVASQAANAIKLVKVAVDMMNLSFKASPLFIIPTLFGVITAVLHAFGISWGDVFNGVIGWIKKVHERFTSWVGWLRNVKVPGWISSLRNYMSDIKSNVQSVWDKFAGLVSWLKKVTIPSWVGTLASNVGGAISNIRKKTSSKKSRHATGTPYFAGGPTSINEGGRGETVVLPSGTQIIPHDVAKKQPALGGKSNITVNVHVAGNVIGNRDFAEYVGSLVAKKVRRAVVHA